MNYENHIIKGADRHGMDVAGALNALSPNERTLKREMFRDHFAQIEAALARQVPKVKILEVLAQAGLSLSANTFTKMLDEERTRRQLPHQINEEPEENRKELTHNDNQEERHD